MQQSILEIKRRLARLLVEKSYREGDFVLASGRRSDYYFDCRVTALHAKGSWLIGTLFNDLLKDVPVVGVGGMTMGADPLVSATTAISHELGRPLNGLLVRKEAKDHGTGQFVEGLGNFKPGDKVAMLEDVVTTGGSLLRAFSLERSRHDPGHGGDDAHHGSRSRSVPDRGYTDRQRAAFGLPFFVRFCPAQAGGAGR